MTVIKVDFNLVMVNGLVAGMSAKAGESKHHTEILVDHSWNSGKLTSQESSKEVEQTMAPMVDGNLLTANGPVAGMPAKAGDTNHHLDHMVKPWTPPKVAGNLKTANGPVAGMPAKAGESNHHTETLEDHSWNSGNTTSQDNSNQVELMMASKVASNLRTVNGPVAGMSTRALA